MFCVDCLLAGLWKPLESGSHRNLENHGVWKPLEFGNRWNWKLMEFGNQWTTGAGQKSKDQEALGPIPLGWGQGGPGTQDHIYIYIWLVGWFRRFNDARSSAPHSPSNTSEDNVILVRPSTSHPAHLSITQGNSAARQGRQSFKCSRLVRCGTKL